MTDPQDCPNIKNHTKSPAGYLAHHEWAEKKILTHDCKRCPDCRRYVIWTPKAVSDD